MAMILATLPGCQNIEGTSSVSQVRIIDTSPDAPGMDIYQGSGALAYNLGFGTATSYVPITPGTYSITADKSGSQQQLISSKGTFGGSTQYTVLIGNFEASLQESIIQDQSIPAPSGEVGFRFLDQAASVGAVDLYLVSSTGTLATSKPVVTGLTFGGNSGYINVPAGTYSVVALATGTVPTSTTVATYAGASVAYLGGEARTVVLINQTLVISPGLQVIIAGDVD
jgi:hypothetical protein